MTADVLPQDLAQEVLCQYADVLRVGCVNLNGRRVSWDTSCSNSTQLQSFTTTLIDALRDEPGLGAAAEAGLLNQVPHWFCKSVSINYALSEVLLLMQEKLGERFGAVCSVRTCGNDGAQLVSYNIEVIRPKHLGSPETPRSTAAVKFRVMVTWSGKGNIICSNLRTRKNKVKGTLSHVETEFPLQPDPDFVPVYKVHMKLRPSRTARIWSKVTKPFRRKAKLPVEEVHPHQPLRSCSRLDQLERRMPCCSSAESPDSSVSTTDSSVGRSGGGTSLEDSDIDDVIEQDVLFPVPLSFEARTVRTPRELIAPRALTYPRQAKVVLTL